jgi:hypothetical protein
VKGFWKTFGKRTWAEGTVLVVFFVQAKTLLASGLSRRDLIWLLGGATNVWLRPQPTHHTTPPSQPGRRDLDACDQYSSVLH